MSDFISTDPDATAPGLPTGPRSDAGKLASSANATTHGLTARRPLCDEEADRMRVIVAQWTARHLPETPPEEALIQSAAIEYVRYLRCVDAEESRLRPATDQALRDWREQRRHATRRQAQKLLDDPAGTVAELSESAFGIDWMIRHWRLLIDHLDSGRGWVGSDLDQSMRLLGRSTRPPTEAEPEAFVLWTLAGAACPVVVDFTAPTGIADAEAAALLRARIADRIERLKAARAIVWEEVDAPQAEAVEVASLVDTSKDGQLRQRYRREALRDFHRSFGQFTRLRVERSKLDARESRTMKSATAERVDEPAWSAPVARPAESPPEPGNVDSRNEPPEAGESAAVDRRKPITSNEIRNESRGFVAASEGRTGRRPEAHRTDPDGRPSPITPAPTAPSRPGDGPIPG